MPKAIPIDMMTSTGQVVCYAQPETLIVTREDIRRGLVGTNRWCGSLPWTTAEHSLLVTLLVDIHFPDLSPRERVIAKAYSGGHDFHEPYIQDVPHGLKPYIPEYRKIEAGMEIQVNNEVGLPWDQRPHKIVEYVDARAALIESTYFGHAAAPVIQSNWLYGDLGGAPSDEEIEALEVAKNLGPGKSFSCAWWTVKKGAQLLAAETEAGAQDGA